MLSTGDIEEKDVDLPPGMYALEAAEIHRPFTSHVIVG